MEGMLQQFLLMIDVMTDDTNGVAGYDESVRDGGYGYNNTVSTDDRWCND
jgi:hypothetical protein